MPPIKRQEHKDLLRVLQRARPSVRKAILKEADKALVYSICELCDNTLSGNVPLTPTQKQKLKKHKTVLKKLAKRGESWVKKEKSPNSKRWSIFTIAFECSSSSTWEPHFWHIRQHGALQKISSRTP